MHIKDYNDAMKFFRTYDSVASKGKWKEFVDEMEFDSIAHEPRNIKLAKVNNIPEAFDPDLEQSEFLRPGETLETWKPNPFLKPHAEGGRIGFSKGGDFEKWLKDQIASKKQPLELKEKYMTLQR